MADVVQHQQDTVPQVRVLLVEDDPDDEFLVRRSLEGTTGGIFAVTGADTLEMGLEQLAKGETDVVLLDLSLPDSSGTDTFRQIQARAPTVPIVVLTGLEDEILGAELVREGGQDYLVKGQVDGTLLSRCINYAIQRKQAETVIRRLADETAVLAEIGRIISASLEIDEVYERFSELVLKLIPSDRIAINLVDLEAWHYSNAYIFGTDIPNRQQGDSHDLSDTYREAIVRTKKGLIIQGLNPDQIAQDYPDLLPSFQVGLVSYLAVPLLSKGQVTGILQIKSVRDRAYTDDDLKLLERIGAQIAGAIANAQLYAQIKQAEESLKRQADELTRSNSELEQFAYVASHDLQEPLRMIKSYVQFLAQDYQGQLGEDADRYINYVVDGADRMRNLIDDLLAFSRVGSQGKPFAPTNCNEVLLEIIADLEAVIKESRAEVTADPLPTVMADTSQLNQLLRNLISNGLKYRGEAPPRVHVTARPDPDDQAWRFSIRDNGIGIDPAYFERIFKMFERLHHRSEYPGTGIGLAICQKIVARHSGRIWVESEPDRGSTFYFTIPMADEDTLDIVPQDGPEEATELLEVLLVDDNPGDIEATQRILERSDFSLNISVAEDGEVAMTHLRHAGAQAATPRPDVIILDLKMPKMDGYQVLDALQADPTLRDIPVMVLTSTISEGSALFEKGLHPSRFCRKPIDPARFDRLVRQLDSDSGLAAPEVGQPASQPTPAPQKKAKRGWWPF